MGVRSEQKGGVLETARSIVKAEGVRGLYRGLGASYWGLSEGAIQVPLTEPETSAPNPEPLNPNP